MVGVVTSRNDGKLLDEKWQHQKVSTQKCAREI
jgi:hypothetical protein